MKYIILYTCMMMWIVSALHIPVVYSFSINHRHLTKRSATCRLGRISSSSSSSSSISKRRYSSSSTAIVLHSSSRSSSNDNHNPQGRKQTHKSSTTTAITTSSKHDKNKHKKTNRKEIGYAYRNQGIKIKRKRPPRWEVEGDSLFFLQSSNDSNNSNKDDDPNSMENDEYFNAFIKSISREYPHLDLSSRIEYFLNHIFLNQREEKQNTDTTSSTSKSSTFTTKQIDNVKKEDKTTNSEHIKTNNQINNMMMWGTLPVGPILTTKLKSMYDNKSDNNQQYSHPTPIQEKSFQILTKKHNNMNNTNPPNNVVIASPTGSGKTLAYILPLLSIFSRKDDERAILILTPTLDLSFQIQKVISQLWDDDSVYVMTDRTKTSSSSSGFFDIDSKQITEWNIEEMLLLKPTIITSTPRILLQMISTINENNKRHMSIFSNLKTIVLDEADRLLQTELLARYNHELKHDNNSNNNSTKNNKNNIKKMNKNNKVKNIRNNGGYILNDCPTIQLLHMMKQKMKISFDVQQQQQHSRQPQQRPVQLICASATVGRTLRRQIMEITNASSIDKGSILITADDRTGKNEWKRKSSLLPDSIRHLYMVSSNDKEEREETVLVETLKKSMNHLEPGSSIVFPGKAGVQSVSELLNATTLRNSDITDIASSSGDKLYSNASSWDKMSMYVIGEKFGRGLDIPNIKYVFISSPPVSPAAYAHLAGRTGRAGKSGIAVTFVRDFKEAKRLVILSKKLGINFDSVISRSMTTESLKESGLAIMNSNIEKEEEVLQLETLTVEELKNRLRERSLKVSGKKSELVSRLTEDLKKQ